VTYALISDSEAGFVDQRTLLIELGCDLGQGYLLSRPLKAAAATELLATELLAAERTPSPPSDIVPAACGASRQS